MEDKRTELAHKLNELQRTKSTYEIYKDMDTMDKEHELTSYYKMLYMNELKIYRMNIDEDKELIAKIKDEIMALCYEHENEIKLN
jgi:hypothetical protein